MFTTPQQAVEINTRQDCLRSTRTAETSGGLSTATGAASCEPAHDYRQSPAVVDFPSCTDARAQVRRCVHRPVSSRSTLRAARRRATRREDTSTQHAHSADNGAVERSSGGRLVWLLDANDEPVVTERDGKTAVHFRPAPDKPWQKLREFDSYIGGEGFFPVQMLADGTSIVRTSIGRDTAALYRFDLRLAQLDRDQWCPSTASTSPASTLRRRPAETSGCACEWRRRRHRLARPGLCGNSKDR